VHILPLIFWGSAILSIGLSMGGLIWRNGWLLVGGAILAGPMSFYLGATPRFRTWAFFLPCLPIMAAVVVKRSVALAAVLLIPFVSLMIWLAVIVLRQNVGSA
jgi:hypothetical protein